MTTNDLLSYIPHNCEHSELIPILEKMPAEILANMVVTTADPDTVLANTNDEFRNIYLLLNGSLKLSYELNTEFFYTFALIHAVNILGETEVFTNYPVYKSTITTATKCQYIVMPKTQFISWMKKDNHALYYMTSHIAQKYTTQVRQDRTLLSASGEDRFIYLLVKYYKSIAIHGICHISTPKELLADEICVSKKTISRSISKLKEQGLLTVQGHILILTQEQYNNLLIQYDYLFV